MIFSFRYYLSNLNCIHEYISEHIYLNFRLPVFEIKTNFIVRKYWFRSVTNIILVALNMFMNINKIIDFFLRCYWITFKSKMLMVSLKLLKITIPYHDWTNGTRQYYCALRNWWMILRIYVNFVYWISTYIWNS